MQSLTTCLKMNVSLSLAMHTTTFSTEVQFISLYPNNFLMKISKSSMCSVLAVSLDFSSLQVYFIAGDFLSVVPSICYIQSIMLY